MFLLYRVRAQILSVDARNGVATVTALGLLPDLHPRSLRQAMDASMADNDLLLRLLSDQPDQLLPARTQMALTLMFHIILVPLGVALPASMLIAEFKGLRKQDSAALLLARRWSHVAGLTFAVGAVSGTVLSFEMGLLWPGLTGVYGDVFGLPFAIEGIAFFLEAILIAVCIYGWRRLKPWTHFWLGLPIPVISLVGAFSIIAANSWMNTPDGFTLDANGKPTNVDPWDAVFTKALPVEFLHFIMAAYMAAGFIVASVYAVGWLKGRRDRLHRLGFLIPFTIAAILAPVQLIVGDTIARWVANNQPAKFAATELVTQSGINQTEYIYGRYDEATNSVSGGLGIPGLDSILVGFSRDTYVQGMNSFPRENLPSNPTLLHWAFDTMVGIGTLLMLLALCFAIFYWRKREVPSNKLFLWIASASGALTYLAIEAGWIVTEVGRQPWIVYNYMRTSEAVTNANGIWTTLWVIAVLYLLLAAATINFLRVMARRWRHQGIEDRDAVYGPRPAVEPEREKA